MADLHHSKHAILLSSSLTTPKPTFMVEFAVVAMLYHMPQAKSGEIVGYRYPTDTMLLIRGDCAYHMMYGMKVNQLCISLNYILSCVRFLSTKINNISSYFVT